MRSVVLFCWLSVLLSAYISLMAGAVQDTEAAAKVNSLEIQFYLMEKSQWTEREQRFKELIASTLSSYCKKEYVTCGLKNWDNSYEFTSSEVSVTDVEQLKFYLNVTYYVKFSPNVQSQNKTSPVVKKVALLESFTDNRTDINQYIGYEVVAVEQDIYSPEPNAKLNRIIIPVAVAFLVVLAIVTVALYHWRKRQDQIEKRQQEKEERKKRRSQKKNISKHNEHSTPSQKHFVPRVQPAPRESTDPSHLQANGRPEPAGRSLQEPLQVDKMQKPSVRSSTFTFNATTSGTVSSASEVNNSTPEIHTDETILNTSDSLHRNTALPPLDEIATNEKKSKKHKKHRNHKKFEDESSRPRQSFNNETDPYIGQSQDASDMSPSIPMPPVYTKRTYSEEDYSDTANYSSSGMPPV